MPRWLDDGELPLGRRQATTAPQLELRDATARTASKVIVAGATEAFATSSPSTRRQGVVVCRIGQHGSDDQIATLFHADRGRADKPD